MLLGIITSLLIAASFFFHGYYLFIFGFGTGFFCLFHALLDKRIYPLIASIVIPAISFAIVFGILHAVDTMLPYRGKNVLGYGSDGYSMNLAALFTPYESNSIRLFFAQKPYPYFYELQGYLGAAFIIGSSLLILVMILKRKFITLSNTTLFKFENRIFLLLGLTAIFLLIMSLGETGFVFHTSYSYTNYLNPMFYLHKFLPEISNIRYVSRFCFPIFFLVNIIFAVCFDVYLRTIKSVIIKSLLVVVIAVMLIVDARDNLNSLYLQENYFREDYYQNKLKIPSLDY